MLCFKKSKEDWQCHVYCKTLSPETLRLRKNPLPNSKCKWLPRIKTTKQNNSVREKHTTNGNITWGIVWLFLHDVLKFGTCITELSHLHKHDSYIVFDLQPAAQKTCSAGSLRSQHSPYPKTDLIRVKYHRLNIYSSVSKAQSPPPPLVPVYVSL
jgi:hypothetical protein